MAKKTTALMSQQSPIYKYAKKKGITEHDEHDVLLDILKAGKDGRTLNNLKRTVREFARDLPRILPALIDKGVVVNKGNKYIGVFAAVDDNDVLLYRALAKVVNL